MEKGEKKPPSCCLLLQQWLVDDRVQPGPSHTVRGEKHELLFSVIRCLSTYKPIRCRFCVHNKAGQDAFYEQVLSSEKQLPKESDSLHMRFQFAQSLVGFFPKCK